ncbi:unnamed protein product [Echinostoma caproni]|uniref:WS_DGAT_C domain-containing protein n=1 Tax=Echinostoma caproni TaxID=27848 RepID=A0A183A5Q2_9TREM|nr:unnamed protein product [Echinostoma caproni]
MDETTRNDGKIALYIASLAIYAEQRHYYVLNSVCCSAIIAGTEVEAILFPVNMPVTAYAETQPTFDSFEEAFKDSDLLDTRCKTHDKIIL